MAQVRDEVPAPVVVAESSVLEGEFTEDEAPGPGLPTLPELDKHYGISWLSYARGAVTRLGYIPLLRWLTGTHYGGADDRALADEFAEHEAPAPGHPNLCAEYGLACLRVDLESDTRES